MATTAPVKEKQGVSQGNTIPPLSRSDGSVVQTACDKVNLLAKHFTEKMCMPDPDPYYQT